MVVWFATFWPSLLLRLVESVGFEKVKFYGPDNSFVLSEVCFKQTHLLIVGYAPLKYFIDEAFIALQILHKRLKSLRQCLFILMSS